MQAVCFNNVFIAIPEISLDSSYEEMDLIVNYMALIQEIRETFEAKRLKFAI